MRIKDIKDIVSAATAGMRRWFETFETNVAGLVTVDEYLIAKGVDAAGRKSWGTRFGTRAAKIARAVLGGNPIRQWETVSTNGRTWKTYGYRDTSFMDAAWDGEYETKIKGA
jgi:hypothetical protein